MASNVRTSAGSTIAISSTLPATYDAAGYRALTFTPIGEVTDLSEIGRESNLVTHNPVATRATVKRKGTRNDGTMTLQIGRDPDDAGQAALETAADVDANQAFAMTLQNGAILYFSAQVMSAKIGVGNADQITGITSVIEIDTENGIVGYDPNAAFVPADFYELYYVGYNGSTADLRRSTSNDGGATWGGEEILYTYGSTTHPSAIEVSPDGNYVAVTRNQSPYLIVYDVQNDIVLTPGVAPGTNVSRPVFNHDSTELAVTYNSSPYIYRYSVPDLVRTADPVSPFYSNSRAAYRPNGELYVPAWGGADGQPVNVYDASNNLTDSHAISPTEKVFRLAFKDGGTEAIIGSDEVPTVSIRAADLTGAVAASPSDRAFNTGANLVHLPGSDRYYIGYNALGAGSAYLAVYDADTDTEMTPVSGLPSTGGAVKQISAAADDQIIAVRDGNGVNIMTREGEAVALAVALGTASVAGLRAGYN